MFAKYSISLGLTILLVLSCACGDTKDDSSIILEQELLNSVDEESYLKLFNAAKRGDEKALLQFIALFETLDTSAAFEHYSHMLELFRDPQVNENAALLVDRLEGERKHVVQTALKELAKERQSGNR